MENDPNNEELDVFVEHPEVVHYTDWAGLRGMVSSGTLWATRYDYLNDSSEVYHLKELLQKSIEAHIMGVWLDIIRNNADAKRKVQKEGGILTVAEHEASAIVGSLYKTTFTGNPDAAPFSIPFIASFCSHSKDNEYQRKNGLLSQWRAYGGLGTERFAIVFDTKALCDALNNETEKFSYPFLQFSDVIYNDRNLDFASKFKKLVGEACKAYDSLYERYKGEGITEKTFKAFVSAATRLKHQAFHEEREVRIAAAPLTLELQQYVKRKTGVDEAGAKAVKPINYRDRNGSRVPYIALFDGQRRALPIRRFIVGPCRDQKSAEFRLRQLVRDATPITVSETPFLG